MVNFLLKTSASNIANVIMANLFNFKIEYTPNLDKLKFYYSSSLLGLFVILYFAGFHDLLQKRLYFFTV